MCEGWLQCIDINNTANIRIIVSCCLYLAENDSLSCITQSALRQVHRLFQSHFSTTCDPVLPIWIYGSGLHCPHPPPLTYILPSIFPSTAGFRRQFLHKVWPIRLAFIQIIYVGYSSLTWLFVTHLRLFHDRSKSTSPSLSKTKFKKPSSFFDLIPEMSKSQHQTQLCSTFRILIVFSLNIGPYGW